jgi:replication initiation and membrane attachment protein DnaB
MEDITWELKNLDSLKEYIFNELIVEHKNTNDINKAINRYAERYHEMQLKLLGIPVVLKSLPQDNYCNVCNLPTDGEKCYSKRCPV